MQPTERRYVVSVMYNRCDPGVFATKAMLSLHRVHAEYIIYAGNLPAGCEDLLRRAKITVWKIPAEMFNITNSRGKHKMRHTVKLVLFQLPGLEPGSRVVTLDTDAVPAQNIDEMFDFITEESPFWAASDPLPTFQMNSGVMLYMKSEGLFKRVMNTFETYGSAFGRDDQDLISFHFQVVENLHSFLPGRYNTIVQNIWKNFRHRNMILDHPAVSPDGFIKIAHYTDGGFTKWCARAPRPHLSVISRQCCAAKELLAAIRGHFIDLRHLNCSS